MKNVRKAINWNEPSKKFYDDIYTKQIEQMWVPEEIPVNDDKSCHKGLDPLIKDTYEKILAGLTLLDTEQTVGITQVAQKTDNLFQKSILTLFAGFETIHARSYSTIFQTLCSNERIDELFNWIEETKELQTKVNTILQKYNNINDDFDLYMAMVGSLCLEGICFYSGFYLPLLLAGQGVMVNSGEIINLILRDEKLHTVGVGYFIKELEDKIKEPHRIEFLRNEAKKLIKAIYEIECDYSALLYKDFDKEFLNDVIRYIEFNVNYTCTCAGYDIMFEGINESSVNPIVINGYSTETKTHDFFSTKGNGYIQTTKVEEIDDDVFDF